MISEEEYIKKLNKLLQKSLRTVKNKKEIAIAFSGGVDSSVIAKLLKNSNSKIKGYVVGIENCKDFISAEKTAKEIKLKLKKIILTEQEIKKALPIQVKILKNLYKKNKDKLKSEIPPLKPNPVSVSFNLPLFFIAKYAEEKYIVSGQGADTMLGGFAKHLKLSKKEAEKEMKKNTLDLTTVGYLQHKKTAEYFNKKILFPYLHKDLVDFCISIPYKFKIKNRTRKYILRKFAEKIGLSKETAYREKKSAQYGTGIMKIMKKIAKKEEMKVGAYIDSLIKNN